MHHAYIRLGGEKTCVCVQDEERVRTLFEWSIRTDFRRMAALMSIKEDYILAFQQVTPQRCTLHFQMDVSLCVSWQGILAFQQVTAQRCTLHFYFWWRKSNTLVVQGAMLNETQGQQTRVFYGTMKGQNMIGENILGKVLMGLRSDYKCWFDLECLKREKDARAKAKELKKYLAPFQVRWKCCIV